MARGHGNEAEERDTDERHAHPGERAHQAVRKSLAHVGAEVFNW